MQSHIYDFSAAGALGLVVRPLVPVAVFAVAMHVGASLGWLPAPRPTLDVDRTILVQKAEASQSPNDAEIVLLGDSSCLMNVSAPLLGQRLGRPVLNLGTLSYLDLNANARLLRNYVETNPGRLRAVVLLMHPDTLRLPQGRTWQQDALQSFLTGTDFSQRLQASDWVTAAIGSDLLHGRVLARMLPRPLPGAFGRQYGFTKDLERYLNVTRGSAVDPESKPPTGSTEYRLAPRPKSASESFRQAVPPGTKLLVAITPLPEKFAGPAYPARHRQLLHEWSQSLGADVTLTNLPGVLNDRLFAQKTHLNAAGQERYTEDLAAALKQQLP